MILIKYIEYYSKKDSRVKIINHEENEGLGAARNTSMQMFLMNISVI